MVALVPGLERTAQVWDRIVVSPPGRNGIPEDLPRELRAAARHLRGAALLDPAQGGQHLGCLDRGDGVVANGRKNIVHQPLQDVLRRAFLPAGSHMRVPLPRDDFEGVGIGDVAIVFGGAPCRGRVDIVGDHLPGVQALFTCFGQADDRVGAKRETGFLVVGLRVAHPPVLSAERGDFQVEAAAVRELVDFVAGLGGFDPQIGEGLDVSGHDGAIRFFGRAKFDETWLHKVRTVRDVLG